MQKQPYIKENIGIVDKTIRRAEQRGKEIDDVVAGIYRRPFISTHR